MALLLPVLAWYAAVIDLTKAFYPVSCNGLKNPGTLLQSFPPPTPHPLIPNHPSPAPWKVNKVKWSATNSSPSGSFPISIGDAGWVLAPTLRQRRTCQTASTFISTQMAACSTFVTYLHRQKLWWSSSLSCLLITAPFSTTQRQRNSTSSMSLRCSQDLWTYQESEEDLIVQH